MSKYQVIFYSENSRYSYFIKIYDMGDTYVGSNLAVDRLFNMYISKLGIDIDEILTRKVR